MISWEKQLQNVKCTVWQEPWIDQHGNNQVSKEISKMVEDLLKEYAKVKDVALNSNKLLNQVTEMNKICDNG